ncbi:hypothetical protein [Halomicrobium salinisoli]|uniref:hypothetical protein n=1 Tax=Halomicrobium salinisoli TaxID=2878391 RepID=UPI001CF016C2|nr:hypothetical protein [Halomicrobium salinisoli]
MSSNQYLRALRRPREAFDGWTPPLSVAVGVVVLLCAVNAASVAYAGDAIAGEVTGTVTVDNPERPPDWVCDGPSAGEVDFEGCDEPETVERSLRSAATDATDAIALKAALAPLAWTLLIGSLFVVVSRRAGGSDGAAIDAFRDGLAVGAVAAVPGSLRALGRPVAVERALADWSHPGTLDGVRAATVGALFPDGPLWIAVVVASGAWTAFVLHGGASSAGEWTDGEATVIAGAGFVAVAASLVPADGGWIGVPGGFGLLLIAGGVVGVVGSYTFIELSKNHELIGFRGKDRVEPKGWYVALHRIGASLTLAAGFVLLDGHALV